MNERLGIIEERQAIAAKYARFAYVAPHDRVVRVPRVIVEPPPQPEEIKVEPAPPVCVVLPKKTKSVTEARLEASLSPPVLTVFRAVMDAFGGATTATLLLGPDRSRESTRPRFASALLMKACLGMSTTQIGRELGKRDHTTAMHAIKRARELLAEDPEWAAAYRAAEHALAQS